MWVKVFSIYINIRFETMNRFLIFFLIGFTVNAQDPLRFTKEVEQIKKKYTNLDKSRENLVFVGSSSIKYWKNVDKVFSGHQIVNSGFGGSMASDLLYFTDDLILAFDPKKVFIYEGDNDISSGKRSKIILKDLKAIIHKIKVKNKDTEIVLISAKPSIARWKHKRAYRRLNRKMKRITKKDTTIYFADIWTPMLDGKSVRKDIFVGDNLHMNSEGYKIWYNVLKNYIN